MSHSIEDRVRTHYLDQRLSDDARRRLKAMASSPRPAPQPKWHRGLVAALVLLAAVGAAWTAGSRHGRSAAGIVVAPPSAPVVVPPSAPVVVPPSFVALDLDLVASPRATEGSWVTVFCNDPKETRWWSDHPILLLSSSADRATVAIPGDATELAAELAAQPVALTSVSTRIITTDFFGASPVSFGDWILFETRKGDVGTAMVLRPPTELGQIMLAVEGPILWDTIARIDAWSPLP